MVAALLRKLWLHKPLRWGSIYIASMFIFAGAYSFMTRDFVQSNIESDPRFQVLDERVLGLAGGLLNDVVGRPVGEDNPSPFVSLNSEVSKVNDRAISLTGYLHRGGSSTDLEFWLQNSQEKLALRFRVLNSGRVGNWLEVSKFDSIDDMTEAGWVARVWSEDALFVHTILLDDEDALEARITEWLGAQDGYVASGSSGLLRMFYFSVVTATTLGYGDIVPVSDRARFIVAVQTILSVVCIGLFLNSVAANGRDSA